MSKHSDKAQQRSSRLRRHAPASIEVNSASNPESDWKIAIPLLSPVYQDQTIEMHKTNDALDKDDCQSSSNKEKMIFRSWQHPAAPFPYDPAPFITAFVPRCT